MEESEDYATISDFLRGVVDIVVFLLFFAIFRIVLNLQGSSELSSGEFLILLVISGMAAVWSARTLFPSIGYLVIYPLQEYLKSDSGKWLYDWLKMKFPNDH